LEKINKISKFFIELLETKEIDKNNKYILNLSQYINDNKCTCITLNYDLLLEEILFLTHENSYQDIDSYDVFYKIPIKQIDERKNTKSNNYGFNFYQGDFNINNNFVEIIKLHGSINWYCDQAYSNSQIYSFMEKVDRYKDELFVDLKPLIIPPILDKTNNYNHILLRSLWKKAFKAIQKAKNIYIYGFSFPITDLSVVYLFKSALQNKQDYKIYVINTKSNIDDKKKRYNEIFGEGKCDFSFCCDDNLEKLAKYLNKKF
ncbi:TPA: SIR2 family protein, partial [Campylobacter coli]|nr:SIR2 family protein [Campylobacter coli]